MITPKCIYIATNNKHKLIEIKAILSDLNVDLKLAQELDSQISWIENETTFEGNARIKALELKKYTRHAVLADDSGLEVDALNGAPGVFSSRFAGKDGDNKANNNKLLEALKNVPHEKRTARFVCCLVYIDEFNNEKTFKGYCNGYITTEERGVNGFGYDPLFFIPEFNKTLAELDEAQKNSISHRYNALNEWRNWLSS